MQIVRKMDRLKGRKTARQKAEKQRDNRLKAYMQKNKYTQKYLLVNNRKGTLSRPHFYQNK